MQSCTEAVCFTPQEKARYQDMINDKVRDLPLSEEDLATTRIAIENFLHNMENLPPEGTLRQRLESIRTICDEPELWVESPEKYPLLQQVVREALQLKATSLKNLEETSAEKRKIHFEEQCRHTASQHQKRQRLAQAREENCEQKISVITTHDVSVRQAQLDMDPELVAFMQDLGATEEQLLVLHPTIWRCFDELLHIQSILPDYIADGILSWERLISLDPDLVKCLLFEQKKVLAALQEGMDMEDLLQIHPSTLAAFFRENTSLCNCWNPLIPYKELFFSLHPEAQLRALLVEAIPQEAPELFLQTLDKEEKYNQFLLAQAAAFYIVNRPVEISASLFEKPQCYSTLEHNFYSTVQISYPLQARKFWTKIEDLQQKLRSLLHEVPQEKTLSLDRGTIFFLLSRYKKLQKVVEGSSLLKLEALLDIEDVEKRCFFLFKAKNVRKLMKKGISLSYLIEHEDERRIKWIVSRCSSLTPLSSFTPLPIFFEPDIPLEVLRSCSLYANSLVKLLEKEVSFENIMAFGEEDKICKTIQNGRYIAAIIDRLEISFDEFSSHPLRDIFIDHAKNIALHFPSDALKRYAGDEEQRARRLFSKASCFSAFIDYEELFEQAGVSLDTLLDEPTAFHDLVLEQTDQLASLLESSLLTFEEIRQLTFEQQEALLFSPESIVALTNFFPLSTLLQNGEKYLFLLQEAENVVNILDNNLLSKDVWLSLPVDMMSFLCSETEIFLSMFVPEYSYDLLARRSPDTVKKMILTKKEEMKYRMNHLFVMGCPLFPVRLLEERNQDDPIVQMTFRYAQEIERILKSTPSLRYDDLAEKMRNFPECAERIFSQSIGISILLKEGVSFNKLFSQDPQDLAGECSDALKRSSF